MCSLVLCTVACGNNNVNNLETNDFRSVVDMSGNKITIPNKIGTYAVAWAGLTDIVAMFDYFEYCAAFPKKSTKFSLLCDFYPNLSGKQKLLDKDISSEMLIDLNVQVVFLKGFDDEELNNKLKQYGISVVDCEFKEYEGLEKVVNIIGETFEAVTSQVSETDRLSTLVIRDTIDYSAFGQT